MAVVQRSRDAVDGGNPSLPPRFRAAHNLDCHQHGGLAWTKANASASGLALGLVFGVALGSYALGILIGVAIGLAICFVRARREVRR